MLLSKSEERTVKLGLNQFKPGDYKVSTIKDELIEPTIETIICFLGTVGTIPCVLIPNERSPKQIHIRSGGGRPTRRLVVITSYSFISTTSPTKMGTAPVTPLPM